MLVTVCCWVGKVGGAGRSVGCSLSLSQLWVGVLFVCSCVRVCAHVHSPFTTTAAGPFFSPLPKSILEPTALTPPPRLYNSPDTIFYKAASKVEAWVKTYLNTHLVYDS